VFACIWHLHYGILNLFKCSLRFYLRQFLRVPAQISIQTRFLG
jgi:hypothetical protein